MPRRGVWLNNPDTNRTLALAAAGLAGTAGFIAGWLREELQRGTTGHSAASLLIVLALLAVAATAFFDGRYGDALGEFRPAMVRRGGFIRLLLGLAASLGGCVAATALSGEGRPAPLIAAGNGVLFVGLALLLGGAARLLMSDGARYAGRKLQERLDDDF
jgi:hypothetical protein